MSANTFKLMISSSIAISIITANSAAFSSNISKCQDKDGKWHYGNGNLHLCSEKSKITTISDNGIRISQVPPVKTFAQIEAEKKEKKEAEAALKKARKERIEKNRILMVYQTEEDIENDREGKLKSLKQKRKQHEQYVYSLKKQSEQFDKKKAATKNVAVKKVFDTKKADVAKKIEKSTKRIQSLDTDVIALNKEFDDIVTFFKEQNK